jgi:hypothetical protein
LFKLSAGALVPLLIGIRNIVVGYKLKENGLILKTPEVWYQTISFLLIS